MFCDIGGKSRKWARGTIPTPHGVIHVTHEVHGNGEVKTTASVPDGVEVVR